MKPRRTLLVGINKKVEWGILSVADIAVNMEIFRPHRPSGPRGTSWPPATRWPRRWICRSRWNQAAVYLAALGAGVGFADYLRPLG